ncbi:MAG: tetratricopeptide repeat protein [Candidatus Xenobium sp.]|jgi:tetratricopeptide (TPR) repeat protein
MVRRTFLLLMFFWLALPATAGNEASFQAGTRAFEQGDYQAATRHFQRAVQQEPGDALSHLWLGMALQRSGQLDHARASLSKALRLGGDSQVAEHARAALQALDRLRPVRQEAALGPSSWRRVGAVQGLLGEDWYVRSTRYSRVWARHADREYVKEFVDNLDRAYEINVDFMGTRAGTPINFYCFSMDSPAHRQPRFAGLGVTRYLGMAVDRDTCLMNLSNWRTSQHIEPWELTRVACHELNHIFLHNLNLRSTFDNLTWFAEALAYSIEDRVLPVSQQRSLETMRLALRGYTSVDEDWRALVAERDTDEYEQYRTYDVLLASIISFLQASYGPDAVPRILRAARNSTLEEGFQAALGRDVPTLHREWKTFYRIR